MEDYNRMRDFFKETVEFEDSLETLTASGQCTMSSTSPSTVTQTTKPLSLRAAVVKPQHAPMRSSVWLTVLAVSGTGKSSSLIQPCKLVVSPTLVCVSPAEAGAVFYVKVRV